jgi:hypothetical protein
MNMPRTVGVPLVCAGIVVGASASARAQPVSPTLPPEPPQSVIIETTLPAWVLQDMPSKVLNLIYEVEEVTVSGPTSRNTSAIQPPRSVHVGVRVTF